MAEAVERVSERLQEDDNGKPLVFRDTMIGNIRDLVDVVPRLNIFGDDELARLCEQVKEKIASVEPDALRPSKTFDPAARAQVKRDADELSEKFAGYFGTARRTRAGGRLMAARVLRESALRVSDCVTELLRKQPFFGSLVLRLPLRPDPTRETLATDGHEIRYSPRWVAETEAHLIETAMARVVMACALKHHTRRGERDPERWQMASQLVTHALIRDAGFTLPPDAEAWDDLSVEQAYDRLPTPEDGDSGDDRRRVPSGAASARVASEAAQSSPDGDNHDTDDSSDSGGDGDPQDEDDDGGDHGRTGDGDGQNRDGSGQSDRMPGPIRRRATIPSGTGEVMDAGARAGDDGGESGETPVDVSAEEQAWDEAMHQALNIARAEGKAPGRVEETVKGAHASTLDWRTLLRRYMTDAAKSDYSAGACPTGASSTPGSTSPRSAPRAWRRSPSLSTPRARCPRRRWPSSGPSCARSRPRSGPRASSCSRSTPRCRTRRNTRPTIFPRRSRSRAAAAQTSGRASRGSTSRESNPRSASTSPTWSAPATPTPSPGSLLPGSTGASAVGLEPRALGRAHRHRRMTSRRHRRTVGGAPAMQTVYPSAEAVRLAMSRIERAMAAFGGDRQAPMDWGIVHRHDCRTTACHAGWYALGRLMDHPAIRWRHDETFYADPGETMMALRPDGTVTHLMYHDGAHMLARDLGFMNAPALKGWAERHPHIWGNRHGERMFAGNGAVAFGARRSMKPAPSSLCRVPRARARRTATTPPRQPAAFGGAAAPSAAPTPRHISTPGGSRIAHSRRYAFIPNCSTATAPARDVFRRWSPPLPATTAS